MSNKPAPIGCTCDTPTGSENRRCEYCKGYKYETKEYVKLPKIKRKKKKTLEDRYLEEASKEVKSWPKWLQKNADLLFEEEQEKQRKLK